MPGSAGEHDALVEAVDGMERAVALARVSLEYGDSETAEADLVRAHEQLAPEFAELRGRWLSRSVSRLHRAAEFLFAAAAPLLVLAVQVEVPETRYIPFFPHVATLVVVALAFGWRPALVNIASAAAAGYYLISLPDDAVEGAALRGFLHLVVSLLVAWAICRPRFRPVRLNSARPVRSATPIP